MNTMEDARSFSWMLDTFVEQTTGVTDAVVVSSDGLLMALSSTLDRARGEQMAAIISGLVSLAYGASSCFAFDGLERIMVAMPRGLLLVGSVSDGSAIGVVARKGCDIGSVGYQMTLLVERAGALLTPALITELRQELLAR